MPRPTGPIKMASGGWRDTCGKHLPLLANHRLLCLCFLLLAPWLLSGCATPDVNPSQARAHTGYVDFHADAANELYWQVERYDDRAQSFKTIYSELDPPAGGFLRLAFAPGHHRLRVTFLNHVITKPTEVEVEVQDGKVTPVRVALTAVGTAQVETREVNYGGTAKGRYGRRTRIGSDETIRYDLSATTSPPISYQPKERMSYEH